MRRIFSTVRRPQEPPGDPPDAGDDAVRRQLGIHRVRERAVLDEGVGVEQQPNALPREELAALRILLVVLGRPTLLDPRQLRRQFLVESHDRGASSTSGDRRSVARLPPCDVEPLRYCRRGMPKGKPREQGDTAVVTEKKSKTQKPRLWKVILHNDDFTTMEFVIHVLQVVFNKPPAEAAELMLQVHHRGFCVGGVYTHEIAETK